MLEKTCLEPLTAVYFTILQELSLLFIPTTLPELGVSAEFAQTSLVKSPDALLVPHSD